MTDPMIRPAGNAEPAQTVEEAQEQLRQTRTELGQTVEALAGKADIKARARAKLDDAMQQVKAKTPDSGQQAVQRVSDQVRTRPIVPAVVAALLIGLFIGRLTRRRSDG